MNERRYTTEEKEMSDWIKANEMKFTKENLQKVKEAATIFAATVKPEKDETTSREVAFVSGFMTAFNFLEVDISEILKPGEIIENE